MKISRIITNTIAKRIGFTVIGKGYAKRHYTFTMSEALAWAACYDDGATVYLNGIFAAHRYTVKAPTVDKVIGKSA
jgi:hypothetical protein